MELMQAILERRSIRKFMDKPLTEEIIRDLLEAFRWAPSWANTQVWEVVVVRDRQRIRDVVDTFSETNPARPCADTVPAIIVVCARINVSGYRRGEQRTRFTEWMMFDLGVAAQNLCLRAHELGLGTVIVGSINHAELDRILNVPEGHASVAAIPVGYPAETAKTSGRRGQDEFTHSERFGDA